jgi:hypothetical protein
MHFQFWFTAVCFVCVSNTFANAQEMNSCDTLKNFKAPKVEITKAVSVATASLPRHDMTCITSRDKATEEKRATSVEQQFGKVAPGLVQYTADVLFRDLWLRPDLAPRDVAGRGKIDRTLLTQPLYGKT